MIRGECYKCFYFKFEGVEKQGGDGWGVGWGVLASIESVPNTSRSKLVIRRSSCVAARGITADRLVRLSSAVNLPC